jgi:hypothetical protein
LVMFLIEQRRVWPLFIKSQRKSRNLSLSLTFYSLTVYLFQYGTQKTKSNEGRTK